MYWTIQGRSSSCPLSSQADQANHKEHWTTQALLCPLHSEFMHSESFGTAEMQEIRNLAIALNAKNGASAGCGETGGVRTDFFLQNPFVFNVQDGPISVITLAAG